MRSITSLFVIFVVLNITACSSSIKRSPYFAPFNSEYELTSTPKKNKIITKNIGEALYTESLVLKIPTIILNEEIKLSGNIGTKEYSLSIIPGEYEYKGSYLNSDLYAANVKDEEGNTYKGGIIVPNDEVSPMSIYFQINLKRYKLLSNKRYNITRKYKLSPDENIFSRSISYTGREGNIIFVTYKKFTNDDLKTNYSIARRNTELDTLSSNSASQTEEYTFDLSNEKEFGIKGVKIKVDQFNNNSIKYTILTGFSKPKE